MKYTLTPAGFLVCFVLLGASLAASYGAGLSHVSMINASLLQRGFLLCSKLISWLVENFSFADGPLYDFTAYTEVNICIWWLVLLIVSSSIVRLICTMLFGCSVKSCQSSHSTMEECSKISLQKISVALPTSRLVSIHQLSYCTISHRAPSTVSLVRILMSP